MTFRVWAVVSAVVFASCTCDPMPTPDAGPNYPHESMPVHCRATAPLGNLELLSRDPEVLRGSFAPNLVGGNISNAQATLISRDRGASFELVTASYQEAQIGPLIETNLAAAECTYVADEHFWATPTPPMGSSEQQHFFTSTGEYLMLTLVVDGQGHQLKATEGRVTFGGITFDFVWKYDATHWVMRSGDWIYASLDGGQTVKRLRPSCTNGSRLKTEAWSGDTIWFHDVANDINNFVRRDGSSAPRPVAASELPPRVDGPFAVTVFRLANWGTRLLAIADLRVWVSNETFTEWTQLETFNDAEFGDVHGFTTDAQGNLWAISMPPMRVVRYRPGETKPTVIDLDFSPARANDAKSLTFAADGTLLFTAQLGPERDLHGWSTCEAGPLVTQGIERIETEPLDAVSSGRVVRIARLQEASELTDKLSVAPSGAVIGGGLGTVIAHAPKTPFLYRTPPFENAEELDAGLSPWAIHGFDDTQVFAVRHNGSSLIDGPWTNLARFDARTGELLEVTRLAETRQVLDVDQVAGQTFHRLDSRRTLFADWRVPRRGDEPPDPPKWPFFVTNGTQATFVGHFDVARNNTDPGPGFTWRLPATKGRFDNPCEGPFDGGAPAGCIEQPPMVPIAAQLDVEGNLFVLDRRLGRVLELAADAGTFVEVARGFVSPSDLRLRRLANGSVAVLVYDGDVWAFVPEAGVVKHAGLSPPMASDDARAVGERDIADCLLDGPCLTDRQVVTHGGTGCVSGRGLGTESGSVRLGSTEGTVTSWSDTKVCFTTPDVDDATLSVRRADLVRSNEVAFVGPAQVTGWELPATVYSDSVLSVTGRNLGTSDTTSKLTGGVVLDRSSTRWRFRIERQDFGPSVQFSKRSVMLGTRTVQLSPRVDLPCHAGADAPCTVFGTGFGNTAHARVDGLEATIVDGSSTSITFRWPAGLSPGLHDVELVGSSVNPLSTVAQVELLAPEQSRLVMTTDAPTTLAVAFTNGRPIDTPAGLLAPLYGWIPGTSTAGPVLYSGLGFADQYRRFAPASPPRSPVSGVPFFERGNAVYAALHQGEVFVLGSAQNLGASELVRYGLVQDGGVLSLARDVGTIVGPDTTPHPIALGEVEGRLVATLSSRLNPKTWVLELSPEGGALAGTPTLVPALYPSGSVAPYTGGSYFTPHGVYFAPCYDSSATVGPVLYLAASVADGGLSFGAPETVFTPPAGLQACNVTPDGLLFVSGDSTHETILKHRPDAGLEVIAQVPATLPGARQRQTYGSNINVPGLVDLAELPNGDVVVLLNDSVNAPRGLRLARYDVRAQTWTVSPTVVRPGTTAQRGEFCVGPVSSTTQCEGWARFGCAPWSCSVNVNDVVERDTVRIGEALLTVRGNEARVVFEVTETKPLPFATGSTESHAVTLQLP